jgi:hypothetical protein
MSRRRRCYGNYPCHALMDAGHGAAKVEIDPAAEAFCPAWGRNGAHGPGVQHLAAECVDIVIPDYGPILMEMTGVRAKVKGPGAMQGSRSRVG